MVEIPQTELPTVKAIYKHYEDTKSDFRRAHLGASLIGKECERELFYTFRWCSDPRFEGRLLRLFENGFKEEARFVKNLRNIGITIYDKDPDTGGQIYCNSFGGHYAGSLDGAAIGFPEASKTWHVCEFKSSNTKEFNKLVKDGIEKVKPLHYAQVQQYMSWTGMKRAFYMVVCKEDDRIYAERVYFVKEVSDLLEAKAKRVIFADVPPGRIADDVDDFRCRFCDHRGVCWEGEFAEVNCRTCAMVTVVEDGTFTCGRDGEVIEPINQRKERDCHIFIPALVPVEATDSDSKKGTITYGKIVNGPGNVLSKDLARAMRERGK